MGRASRNTMPIVDVRQYRKDMRPVSGQKTEISILKSEDTSETTRLEKFLGDFFGWLRKKDPMKSPPAELPRKLKFSVDVTGLYAPDGTLDQRLNSVDFYFELNYSILSGLMLKGYFKRPKSFKGGTDFTVKKDFKEFVNIGTDSSKCDLVVPNAESRQHLSPVHLTIFVKLDENKLPLFKVVSRQKDMTKKQSAIGHYEEYILTTPYGITQDSDFAKIRVEQNTLWFGWSTNHQTCAFQVTFDIKLS